MRKSCAGANILLFRAFTKQQKLNLTLKGDSGKNSVKYLTKISLFLIAAMRAT
jgi:hypothetical protein